LLQSAGLGLGCLFGVWTDLAGQELTDAAGLRFASVVVGFGRVETQTLEGSVHTVEQRCMYTDARGRFYDALAQMADWGRQAGVFVCLGGDGSLSLSVFFFFFLFLLPMRPHSHKLVTTFRNHHLFVHAYSTHTSRTAEILRARGACAMLLRLWRADDYGRAPCLTLGGRSAAAIPVFETSRALHATQPHPSHCHGTTAPTRLLSAVDSVTACAFVVIESLSGGKDLDHQYASKTLLIMMRKIVFRDWEGGCGAWGRGPPWMRHLLPCCLVLDALRFVGMPQLFCNRLTNAAAAAASALNSFKNNRRPRSPFNAFASDLEEQTPRNTFICSRTTFQCKHNIHR